MSGEKNRILRGVFSSSFFSSSGFASSSSSLDSSFFSSFASSFLSWSSKKDSFRSITSSSPSSIFSSSSSITSSFFTSFSSSFSSFSFTSSFFSSSFFVSSSITFSNAPFSISVFSSPFTATSPRSRITVDTMNSRPQHMPTFMLRQHCSTRLISPYTTSCSLQWRSTRYSRFRKRLFLVEWMNCGDSSCPYSAR